MQNKRIAIVGAGVTGLGAAWLLHKTHTVTLFEKNDYLGGHTHTIEVPQADGSHLPVDTGFIVYNERNYPNLIGLLAELDVPTRAASMSFAFSLNQGELEYSGSGLAGLFAQRRNYFSVRHYRLIAEILRFNRVAHQLLADQALPSGTLHDLLEQHQFSQDLREHYLLPMGAAIWSCPVETMLGFPARSFLQFFANHGLIDLRNRPQWRTVVGGSHSYVKAMQAQMGEHITLKPAAQSVERMDDQVYIHTAEERLAFDAVIMACHADEALALLQQPSEREAAVLGCFGYESNRTYLHTDTALMPQRKAVWSSWNYLATSQPEARQQMTATYWMNHLQGLQAPQDYFVTLNPWQPPREECQVASMTYEHPVFDQAAVAAQAQLPHLQGQQQTWFCGSYTRYGFHEDALMSAVAVCRDFGVTPSWESA